MFLGVSQASRIPTAPVRWFDRAGHGASNAATSGDLLSRTTRESKQTPSTADETPSKGTTESFVPKTEKAGQRRHPASAPRFTPPCMTPGEDIDRVMISPALAAPGNQLRVFDSHPASVRAAAGDFPFCFRPPALGVDQVRGMFIAAGRRLNIAQRSRVRSVDPCPAAYTDHTVPAFRVFHVPSAGDIFRPRCCSAHPQLR